MATSDWLTWEQAAALVGCPVPTIDWNKRTGRIRSRRQRPSLERASVEEFAQWWQTRREDREARRTLGEQRNRRDPPGPTGWLTTEQAAAVLGCTTRHITRLTQSGTLQATRAGGRIWLRESTVNDYVTARQQWLSHTAAAALAGCSTSTIARAADRGTIEARHLEGTAHASLSRASVEKFAAALTVRRQEAARARADTSKRRSPSDPPEDGDVWLDATTTALVLRISTTRLGQLAETGRVPHEVRGRRRWYRRGDVERLSAARALA